MYLTHTLLKYSTLFNLFYIYVVDVLAGLPREFFNLKINQVFYLYCIYLPISTVYIYNSTL